MGKEFTNGMMAGNTTESGRITKCTATEYSRGLMGKCIKEITFKIKNMDLESFIGLMVNAIKENGKMGNSTVKGCYWTLNKMQVNASTTRGRELCENGCDVYLLLNYLNLQ